MAAAAARVERVLLQPARVAFLFLVVQVGLAGRHPRLFPLQVHSLAEGEEEARKA